MDILKKMIMILLTAAATMIFPETVYGAEEGRLIYYKDDVVIEERVIFNNANDERNSFLLLNVLVYSKCENVPDSLKILYTFLDEGELTVGVSDEFLSAQEYEKGLLTEQMTKTACSLKGVDSIMVYVKDRFF